MSDSITYQKAGVDPHKAASILGGFSAWLQSRPKNPALSSVVGPFASLYSLKTALQDMKDPLLVSCCDGVGTKAKLALDWGRIDGLGTDLVAMNVNDLICTGGRPLVFLDYYACGKLQEAQLLSLLKGIQLACEQSDCSLAGGETAEMPGLYQDQDFDLAGFAVGLVDRADSIGPEKVRAGNVLIAIESSGVHSNGFSLVRKLVDSEGIEPHQKAPFSTDRTWADVLLAPTHLYVRPIAAGRGHWNALAHITGGGLFENLPRVLPNGVTAKIESAAWPFPPLFQWIQKTARLSTEDMLSTFNCGVGMIGVCDAKNQDSLISSLKSVGLKAWFIGTIEAAGKTEGSVEWR